MPEYNIALATLADADTISDFNCQMALETENKILPVEIINSGVKRLMQSPQYGFYLVARTNDEVIGTCMVTTEWSDWRDGLFWWVQSVYVKKSHRRQGVYRAMYQYLQALSKNEPDVYGFRLYVEKDNHIAQKTYDLLLSPCERCFDINLSQSWCYRARLTIADFNSINFHNRPHKCGGAGDKCLACSLRLFNGKRALV